MSAIQAIILGVVQGLTEFLPASSSGHLVLGKHLLGVKTGGVAFEVFVHLGTLLAVIVAFRRRIGTIAISVYGLFNKGFHLSELSSRKRAHLRLTLLILVGSVPAAMAGLWLRPFFEQTFQSPIAASCVLMVTGGLLFSTHLIKTGGKKRLSFWDAVIVGLAQAAAILPGISRSGMTIGIGLWLGISPRKAAEFSFLLSLPVILGASGLELWEVVSGGALRSQCGTYGLGALAALVVGYGAILLLVRMVKRGRLWIFAPYCWVVGIGGLMMILWL